MGSTLISTGPIPERSEVLEVDVRVRECGVRDIASILSEGTDVGGGVYVAEVGRGVGRLEVVKVAMAAGAGPFEVA